MMESKKIIHQIMITESEKVSDPANLSSILQYFPDHMHLIWGAREIKNFMKKNKDTEVLEAFNKIKPFAFKADLARYYILHYYGGWYTDLNNFFTGYPPKTEDIDIVVFRDFGDDSVGTWAVQNSLFFCHPRNKIFSRVINKCIKNIMSEYYGPHPLSITGPMMFGQSLAEEHSLISQRFLAGYFGTQNSGPKGFYLGEDLLALYKPNILNKDLSVLEGNKYEDIWYSGDVYKKTEKA